MKSSVYAIYDLDKETIADISNNISALDIRNYNGNGIIIQLTSKDSVDDLSIMKSNRDDYSKALEKSIKRLKNENT